MCLILLAWQAHPEFPLVVAANRDEFFARPTVSGQFWNDSPNILAGRDLSAGGTWMGVTRNGRFAALTNFRDLEHHRAEALSRGRLVSDFLSGKTTPVDFLNDVAQRASAYNDFNLICGTLQGHDYDLWYFSNRSEAANVPRQLTPGIYGLSNHLLDTPWPKVVQKKSELTAALSALPQEALLFDLLRDERIHEDERLPRTGVSLEWERILSAAFVRSQDYGTRSSTVLLQDRNGFVSFDEQTFLLGAKPGNRSRFRFRLL